jgi:hypothetical protein
LTGVAKVLSTATKAGWVGPIRSMTPATSTTFNMGLVGVSIHTSRVLSVTAAATAPRSVWSTMV